MVVGCGVTVEVVVVVGVSGVVRGHRGLSGKDGKRMIRIENKDKLGWISSVSH